MYISLNTNNYGNLLDPFNGQKHLQERKIKTPLNPNKTYHDDPLRMIRAIRFATQLNFKIRRQLIFSYKKNYERLSIISQERITEELNKIILSKTPSLGFKMLLKQIYYINFFKILFN